MIFAHGDTPFHDDPTFWHALAAFGGVGGALSFLWYSITNLFK